jgi:hypothetical protein
MCHVKLPVPHLERTIMPRFGTKSLLVGVAIAGLWLSTVSGSRAGADIRAGILPVIVFAAAFAAIYYRGRQQAIWIGFVARSFSWQFNYSGALYHVSGGPITSRNNGWAENRAIQPTSGELFWTHLLLRERQRQ